MNISTRIRSNDNWGRDWGY